MNYLLLLLTGLAFIACNSPQTDLVREEKAIRSLLEQERKAHFARDAALFASEFADTMTSVNKGKVAVLSRQQHRERIEPYFNSVEFIKWDDKARPVIRFSADGSLAYAIVQKEVILYYPDSTGKAFYDTTHYAWVSVYRKQAGEWKVECNVSTNQ
jgi:uncharacterized protein (TIGR02246 family)